MKTILVVDDDKLNLSAARKVLSGEYKVIPVVRGTQVLSYLENEECDMIFWISVCRKWMALNCLEKFGRWRTVRTFP